MIIDAKITHSSGQEIVPIPHKFQEGRLTVKSLLSQDAYKKRFQEVLGETAPQFLASIASTASSSHLASCQPQSVIAAAFIAATLDLPIDRNLGFAHLVPYKGIVQFQMGYKGFIQLAQRSGLYLKLSAVVVPEGVFVSYDELKDELILDWSLKKSDAPVGYAAYFKLANGYEKVRYWSKEKVEKHAGKYSQAFKAGKKDSPWFNNFDSMALKTVIKDTLSHWGPLSVALRKALASDQSTAIDIDSEPIFPDGPEPEFDEPTKSRSEQVSDLLDDGLTEADKKSILAKEAQEASTRK